MKNSTLGFFAATLLLAGCEGSLGGTFSSSGSAVDSRADMDVESPGSADSTAELGPMGRTPLRRLNQDEYRRTVLEVFGLTLPEELNLPQESFANGYDNQGNALSVSPLHVERFYGNAVYVADAVVGDDGESVWFPSFSDDVKKAVASDLPALLAQLYRREAAEEDLAPYLELCDVLLEAEAPPVEVLRSVVVRSLLAPEFLFRLEGGEDGERVLLDDEQIATRLSYLLWRTVPDEELLRQAREGQLIHAEKRAQQAERMLTDERSEALFHAFASQWLTLDHLDEIVPSSDIFPEFDEEVRAEMSSQIRAMIEDWLEGRRSLRDLLLRTDFLVGPRLAEWDDVSPGTGVDLSASGRLGLLGTPGFLALTSHPDTTSPVKRGYFVLSQLLCDPPPPPPPNIDPLEEEPGDGKSLRETLEQHVSDPSCSGCHLHMDPIGFSLGEFDAIGAKREIDEFGASIDTLSVLPDGQTLSNVSELATFVAEDARFTKCVAENLITYALGRAPQGEDLLLVDSVAGSLETGGSFAEAVSRVVENELFITRGPLTNESE